MALSFLKLCRWQNLLLIIISQCVVKYALINKYIVDISLNNLDFSLLVLSSILIAAAGYIINDINDVEIDKINKPEKVLIGYKISIKNANNIFLVLNIVGVLIGFYISNKVGKSNFTTIFILISALLYAYSVQLKKVLIVSNILIAFVIGLSILIVPIFDILPSLSFENREGHIIIFQIILDYALFAFFINWIREIIKDIEDAKGDKLHNVNSIPLKFGVKSAKVITSVITLVPMAGILYYALVYLSKHTEGLIYFGLFLFAPLVYFIINLWSAEENKDFKKLQTLLKLVMLLGVFSIVLFQFIL
jgi:4-hydroxybenzoate polyprenyltransferase